MQRRRLIVGTSDFERLDREHENAVLHFLREVASLRPITYRTVCEKYVVLSEHQMRHRLRRQIAVGDGMDVEVIGRRVRPLFR